MREQVNLIVAVNAADIRTETYNGREHLVLPSYTLPDDVIMNGGLYTHDEIERSYNTLENTLAPIGHPQLDGEYISAYHPAAINSYHAGAFNRNVKRVGNRIYIEKFLDVEFAKNSESGRALLDAVAKKQPIHSSTGIMLTREPAMNGEGYDWIARNMTFDHDAILINEIGAATPEQGVGLFVNVADAKPLKANSDDVLSDTSYGAIRDKLDAAIKAKYATGPDTWAYVEDFDAVTVVYSTAEGYFEVHYAIVDDVVTLGAETAPVAWESKFVKQENHSIVNKILGMLGFRVPSKPAPQLNTEEVDMTPEQLQALLDAQAQTLSESTATAVNAAVAPLAEKLATLEQANTALASQLQANAAEAEAEMKDAVKAEFGEDVAAALTGNALKSMFAKCAKSAPILGGLPAVNGKDGLDDTLPE